MDITMTMTIATRLIVLMLAMPMLMVVMAMVTRCMLLMTTMEVTMVIMIAGVDDDDGATGKYDVELVGARVL